MVALRWSWTFALLACRPAAPPEEPVSEPPAAETQAEAPVETPAEPAESAPASSAPATGPVSYKVEDNRLILPQPIDFMSPTADSSPGPGSEVALEHIRGYLAAKDYVTTMRIEGHVVGPGAQELSERRALAVAKWLVAHGVDCKRLLPVGFGDTKPVADNSTAEGRAQNNRIEAVNAGLRGRPIGGMPLDGAGSPAGDPCQ